MTFRVTDEHLNMQINHGNNMLIYWAGGLTQTKQVFII